ncbi:hypothetical protein EV363DRAFT_1185904 [Boletus edulis]|nr:hypothetical protein EV363DRAFT_1185904 [Boletus edulis]
MSVQHALPLNYVNSDISFGQNGRTAADPISFSDEMTNIHPGLAGGGWNFSAIGLDVFDPNLHPPPQFDTVADPPLPPLPPVPQEITPGRPRLPAVPLPSPLINGTPVNANNDTSRTRPKSRGRGRRNVASMPKSPLARKMAAKALKPQDCAVSGIATGVGLSMIPPSNSTASVDLLQDPNPPLTQQANASTSTDLSGMALPVIQHPLTQQNPAPPSTLRPSKRIPIQSKRNAMSDAIGTTRQTFVGADNNQQVSSANQKTKRTANTTDGKTKKYILFHCVFAIVLIAKWTGKEKLSPFHIIISIA